LIPIAHAAAAMAWIASGMSAPNGISREPV
jgi:hypothetical protein